MSLNDFSSRLHVLRWPLALLLANVLACTSVPLPPMAPKPPVAPVNAAPKPAAAPVVKAPAPPIPAPTPAPVVVSASPFSAAVEARFPDPPVSYRTPAFEPGHTGLTSNVELQALLRGLARPGVATGGTLVKLLSLGSSQGGVPLEALLLTRSMNADPEALRRDGRPTVLLIGQQHGDEPAGAEALIVLAQELAQGALGPLLERINVVILPRANPDGAQGDRRVTSSGVDANRDHLLLNTPEAQAQAQLAREYRPAVVVDAHEYTVSGPYVQKFGAVQGVDAMLQYAMTANLSEFVTKAAEEWFRQPVLASLKREGLSSEWYHTTSEDLADKKISMGGTQPDTSRNVNGLRNAVSLLIETRGAGIGRLHLKRRVHTHVTAITTVLQQAAKQSEALAKLRQFVDYDVSAQACQGEAVVETEPTSSEYSVLMLDPVSGADKPVTVTWDSALELHAVKTRPRPCGYWVAAEEVDAVRRLRNLGVLVEQLAEKGVMRGATYREIAREGAVREVVLGGADAVEVRRPQVELVPALIDVDAGSYYVPLDQPLANLAMAALEPDTPNSYFANRIFSGLGTQARVMSRPEMKMVVVP